MRIAIVQETIDASRGGAETSVSEMAHALAALGADVTIVTAAAEPLTIDNVKTANVLPGLVRRDPRAFVAAADEFCRRERFDIVHAVTPCLSANIYQPRGGTYLETVERSIALAGSPIAQFVKRIGRRFNFRQRYLLSVERQLLTGRSPPFVAAVSQYVRRQVIAGYGLAADCVRVVFNGVDIVPLRDADAADARHIVRSELNLGDNQSLILFVAHNFKLKGLAELIRAAACPPLAARDFTIAIAGRDTPARYHRLAAQLGVARRVRFLGAGVLMPRLYAAADVLAHPTWYDPCSRVVLEALGSGLPVVTTHFNGAAEVIDPQRHGVVIDSPADVHALAAAITNSLAPELRATCRADAARLREKLSMKRHARELLDLYRNV